jgi:hypothetical protein
VRILYRQKRKYENNELDYSATPKYEINTNLETITFSPLQVLQKCCHYINKKQF